MRESIEMESGVQVICGSIFAAAPFRAANQTARAERIEALETANVLRAFRDWRADGESRERGSR